MLIAHCIWIAQNECVIIQIFFTFLLILLQILKLTSKITLWSYEFARLLSSCEKHGVYFDHSFLVLVSLEVNAEVFDVSFRIALLLHLVYLLWNGRYP